VGRETYSAQTLQSKKCIVLPRTFANVGLPDLTP